LCFFPKKFDPRRKGSWNIIDIEQKSSTHYLFPKQHYERGYTKPGFLQKMKIKNNLNNPLLWPTISHPPAPS
jgi:hypothetical protein